MAASGEAAISIIRLCNFVVQFNGMGVFRQLGEYLFLRKKDPARPKSAWIGYMHGINRLSLFIFIICLIILAVKLLRK
jgi:hypothetical protein